MKCTSWIFGGCTDFDCQLYRFRFVIVFHSLPFSSQLTDSQFSRQRRFRFRFRQLKSHVGAQKGAAHDDEDRPFCSACGVLRPSMANEPMFSNTSWWSGGSRSCSSCSARRVRRLMMLYRSTHPKPELHQLQTSIFKHTKCKKIITCSVVRGTLGDVPPFGVTRNFFAVIV